jgi:hypothetical protein
MKSLESLATVTHRAVISQSEQYAIGPDKTSKGFTATDVIGPDGRAVGTWTPGGAKPIGFEVYDGTLYLRLPSGEYADAPQFTASGLAEVMVDGQALNFANHIKSVSLVGPATFAHQTATAYRVTLDPAYINYLASNLSSVPSGGSGASKAGSAQTTTTTPLVTMSGLSLVYYLDPASGVLLGLEYKAQAVASGQRLTQAFGGQLPPNLKGDNVIFTETQTAVFSDYGMSQTIGPPKSAGLLTAGEENELFVPLSSTAKSGTSKSSTK